VETPEGFLRIRATFARTGCQAYSNPDGSQRVEYRPESEVARQDSFLSLGGLPVTLEHPPQLLTPDTARQYQRGASGTHVVYDNGFVHGTVVLTDREAIEAVKRGDATELSVGYRCEYDATPGVAPDGTRYDGVQRAISGNHHAITRKARAGSEVRLHFDSADGDDQPIVAVSAELIPSFEDTSMATSLQPADRTDMKPPTKKASSKPKDMEEEEGEQKDMEEEEGEQMDGYDKAKGRKDAAPAAGKTVPWDVYKATVDDLAASELRFDSLSEQLAELEQLVAERTDSAPEPDPELINQLVAERVDVLEKAADLTGNRERHDGLSNREVMVLALEAAEVRIDGIEDRSDEYVAARFDAAHETAEKIPYRPGAANLLALQLQGLTTPRSDSTGDGIAEAAAEHQKSLANAWQTTAG
jgi:hypothetical protein